MAVPQGSAVAGKPWREITAAELGVQGAVIAPGGTLSLQPVPWWAGGFTKCRLTISFNLAVGGPVDVSVIGVDTEQSFSVNDSLIGTPYVFPAGGSAFEFNFDDGPLPGNWRPIAVVPQGPASMALNPTWNKAALLQFLIQNSSAAPMTISNLTFSLRGD